MATYNPVNPQNGWELDLHSVYSAYIAWFQQNGTPYWDEPWGEFFMDFQSFLYWGWPAITVTSVYEPYEPHIVTTLKSLHQFLKMINTRYGQKMEEVANMTKIRPFERNPQTMHYIDSISAYERLHATLPAVALAAQKKQIYAGSTRIIEMLWKAKDKTFLAIDFEWAERDPSSILEFGYAALRARHLVKTGNWPPVPEDNYRRGHFVVAEHVDVVANKHCPTFPRSYAFGHTHVVPKHQFRHIIQSIIDSLASPDSQTQANDLVLVAHGISGDLKRLNELQIRLPSNVLILDTSSFERELFRIGKGATTTDTATRQSRQAGSTLSLSNLLRSLNADTATFRFHNSGNDSFGALMCLQLLLEQNTTSKYLTRTTNTINGASSVSNESEFVAYNGTVIVVGVERREESTAYEAQVSQRATTIPRGRGHGRGRRGQRAHHQQIRRERRIEDDMRNLSFD
ncbi:SubName: Full=Uncharacterized protein {ECO:0000313/EMBL:CCA70136.1} [Serendipita indica DSM 11827]|uniref:Gfd2/YDR514C-like C-terminal domain-containing protein n=1 Tax=Serendipita indica (strain DSM 11827) TaxID=1109443 RepID=G4TFQ5_SERID|nr:SubName: Full=Uncharacterized protein {ECO:0000313/EMBL:CCA70136.1} [Serendipita indica DSM 11827]CCA70136.1 hypothetical protein PIIN_04075 [Serendipita indica DSM 11827]